MDDPLSTWWESFPAEWAEKRLAALENEHAARGREIDALRRDLAQYREREIGASEQSEPSSSAAVHESAQTNGDRPAGMEAVEIVMSRRPGPWTRADIYKAMVDEGWLAPGKPGRGTIGSIMYRMVNKGRVVREGPSIYRLPPTSTGEVAE